MSKRLELAKRITGKEQYYTMPEVVDRCIELALPYLGDEDILEPAGGTGEFIKGLMKRGIDANRIQSFDIEPKYELVEKADFLNQTMMPYAFGQVFTITNPPYGRANSLAVKFFNHAAECSTYICFLVPKAWRKWSVINKLNEHYHLVDDVDMPKIAFYNDDGPIQGGNLSTVFQVWERRTEKRQKITVENRGYLENSTPTDADVAITFFGYSSGRIETEFERVPNTTKKYFKIKDQSVVTALQNVDFTRFNQNVSYTPALSILEINYLLNEYFDTH
jgi:hypothetical protein